jgi:hypothetical protein
VKAPLSVVFLAMIPQYYFPATIGDETKRRTIIVFESCNNKIMFSKLEYCDIAIFYLTFIITRFKNSTKELVGYVGLWRFHPGHTHVSLPAAKFFDDTKNTRSLIVS